MIEIAIVFDVKRDIAPVIGTHRHALLADPLDRPERAIFHLQTALVAQEHDAVAGGKIPFAAFGFDANVVAKITVGAQRYARSFVEYAHLGLGMGETD